MDISSQPPNSTANLHHRANFSRTQRRLEPRQQILLVLHAKTDSDQPRLDAEPRGPIQLAIVRQNGIRTREGKVGSKTGTLEALKRIEKSFRRSSRRERERKQASVPPFLLVLLFAAARSLLLPTTFIVLWRAVLWIKHLFDNGGRSRISTSDRARSQKITHNFRVGVDTPHATFEISRVSLEVYSVFVKIVIFKSGIEVLLQNLVVLPLRVQNEAGMNLSKRLFG
jgi:hypothetical protein